MLIPTITLQPGDSGDNVRELQRRLVAVDQLSESQINGSYDGPTTEGVKSFQGIHGLKPDGIAGPRTIRKLNAVVAGTASSGDGETRQEEEEKEKEIESQEEVAFAIDEQERAKSEEELGIKQEEPNIAVPPPPALDDIPPMDGPETTEALFLDDPSLETDMVKSASAEEKEPPKEEKAPKEPEAKEASAAQKEMDKAATLPEPKEPREPIKFDDKTLEAIDRSLPEPVKMEVKQVGVVMMKNGVQQAAVPPDMDIGGPSQTPQQQKQQSAELG